MSSPEGALRDMNKYTKFHNALVPSVGRTVAHKSYDGIWPNSILEFSFHLHHVHTKKREFPQVEDLFIDLDILLLKPKDSKT